MEKPKNKNITVILGYRCRSRKDYFEKLALKLVSIKGIAPLLFCQKTFIFYPLLRIPFGQITKIVNYRIKEYVAKKHQQNSRLALIKIYKCIWFLESYIAYIKTRAFLKRNKADLLVVWNGHRWLQASMILAAQKMNIQTVYAESGYFKDSFTLDPDGVNASSKIPRSKKFYQNYFELSGLEAVYVEKLEFKTKMILVPFQIEHDSQTLLHSPWISDMHKLVDEVIKILPLLPSDWVIKFKIHPKSPLKLNQVLLKSLPVSKVVEVIMEGSVNTLLDESSCVITMNSTVGIEALSKGKPVIMLGDANYNVNSVVLDAKNRNEFHACVNQVLNGWLPSMDVLTGLMAYQKNEYHVYGDYRKMEDKHVREVAKRLRVIHQSSSSCTEA